MIPLKFIPITIPALFLLARHASGQTSTIQLPAKSTNALVTALWFSHAYGMPETLTPNMDRQLKTKLIAALRGNQLALSWDSVTGVFKKDEFDTFSGGKDTVTVKEMERMLRDKTPRSRESLFAKLKQHADLLTTQFDLIEERHRDAANELAAWIVKNYRPGNSLHVMVICTGNSRRSMLGSTMGNVAAAYYGLPGVRFYSGGTTPSAFNPRTIAALKEIGVHLEPTGKEATRGSSGEPNPIYRVRWGKDQAALEFSKVYTDAHNPQKNFAAILVCSEADTACPTVRGASVRIPVPYADPKAYDGAPFEAAKYAERRDDIGRFMLNVLMQASRRLNVD